MRSIIKQIFDKKNLQKVFSDEANEDSLIFDFLILFFILVSCILYIIQTSITNQVILEKIYYLDFILNVIFTIELIMRLSIVKSFKKILTPSYLWIDIIAIAPFLIGLGSFQFFRAFRFLRVFRFFRFFRYSARYLKFQNHHEFPVEKIFIIRILFTIFIFIYVSASLIYQFEAAENPGINVFGDALYFMIIATTTVGLGDISPVTNLGKVVVIFTVLSALVIIPWHIGMLVKFFSRHSMHEVKEIGCNSCSKKVHRVHARHCDGCGEKLVDDMDMYREYSKENRFLKD